MGGGGGGEVVCYTAVYSVDAKNGCVADKGGEEEGVE